MIGGPSVTSTVKYCGYASVHSFFTAGVADVICDKVGVMKVLALS